MIFSSILVCYYLIISCPKKNCLINYTLSITETLNLKNKIIAVIIFFFIGIYGGFVQAGVGIIIIAALSLIMGISLFKINSIKVFIIAIYVISSLLGFIYNGKVNWMLGFILAVGNAFGAWIDSNLAVSKGEKLIKTVLTIAVIIMALNLLGII
jgi:hypothetical protein